MLTSGHVRVTSLALRLIERKRDGGRVEPGEWRALASAYAAGHVPDYQMAAFLMAVYIRGLDRGETHALTDAMLATGARLALGEPERNREIVRRLIPQSAISHC